MITKPTKYNPEMNARVIQLMAEGKSQFEVSVELEISKSVMYNWLNENHDNYQPEFAAAVEEGRLQSQAWWERKLREAAVGINKDANATLMIYNMKNRFRDEWADTQTVNSNVNFAQVSDSPASSDEWLKTHKPR